MKLTLAILFIIGSVYCGTKVIEYHDDHWIVRPTCFLLALSCLLAAKFVMQLWLRKRTDGDYRAPF